MRNGIAIIEQGLDGKQVSVIKRRSIYMFNELGSKIIKSLADKPKTIEELVQETKIPREYIEEFLQKLLNEDETIRILEVEDSP